MEKEVSLVTPIIEQKRDDIEALCRKHRVRALWLFGSATTDKWDQQKSDFDFLVDLGDYEPGIADRLLGLADDLEAVVGRSIDLITTRGLASNPRLERRVNEHRVKLYESGRDRAVARRTSSLPQDHGDRGRPHARRLSGQRASSIKRELECRDRRRSAQRRTE